MKNKSVKTMVASVLAVGLMMSIPASAFAVSPGGMSVPSAQSVDSSENCAQILDWLGIQIPRHFDSQAPYKINTLSESDPNYWQAEWETQVYNYKMVRNYPTLYTQDAWDAAQSAGTVMMGLHPESLTDANKQQILKARDAIAALADHQLKPYSDGINGEVIYLWGDDMPVTTPASDLQFPLVNYEGEAVYDNADFQPILIPYLLDDPSSAKGTILVTSGGPLETENPNLPHMFIAVGADDQWEGSLEMFKQAYALGLDPELHVYGLNGHGFGAGMEGTSSMTWMETCDLYMQKVMGYAEIPFTGEIPAEYTLTQQIHVNWFPIGDDVTVNVYTTADGGKCLFTFFGWGENIMVEGLLIGGHVASVTYDSVGYFGQDAAKMWDLVDPAAWVPVN